MTAHAIHSAPSAAVAVPRTAKPPPATGSTLRRPMPTPTLGDQSTQEQQPSARSHSQSQQQHVAHEPVVTHTATSSPPDAFPEFTQPPTAAAAALHWRAHSDLHFAVRKQMIGRLQRLHPLLATDSTMRYAGQFTRIPELVQRLELMLYKAAASLDEYANVCTLERRVHALVTLLEPLPPPATTGSASAYSHKRHATASTESPLKRRRRSLSSASSSSVSASISSIAPSCRLTTELSTDLLAYVFAFVDGVDTLRSVALVNRFFQREAPRLVRSLCIDVGDAAHAHALHGRVAQVLTPCHNLTALTVTNSRNIGKKNGFTRAFTGDDHDDPMALAMAPPVSSDPMLFTGRVFLHELSELWLRSRHVVFPKLQRLELRAPFDCANEADATLPCLHALATNLSLLSPTLLAFDTLVLDTTVLGDRRLARLVTLLHAFPRVFVQRLRVLELRNNFVGEAGAAVLCRALVAHPSGSGSDTDIAAGAWYRLETLRLPRNILTDGDAYALARCLGSLPQLRTLDVSENFFGKPGFEALARGRESACGNRGDRDAVAIATAHNCMESREAAHLFR